MQRNLEIECIRLYLNWKRAPTSSQRIQQIFGLKKEKEKLRKNAPVHLTKTIKAIFHLLPGTLLWVQILMKTLQRQREKETTSNLHPHHEKGQRLPCECGDLSEGDGVTLESVVKPQRASPNRSSAKVEKQQWFHCRSDSGWRLHLVLGQQVLLHRQSTGWDSVVAC